MQTTTLPIQVGNSAGAAPQRAQNAPANDGPAFSQALSHEMAQRQNAAAAAPANPAAQTQAKAADGKPAAQPGDAGSDKDKDDAADAAAANPMADMIALAASLQPPAAAAAAVPAEGAGQLSELAPPARKHAGLELAADGADSKPLAKHVPGDGPATFADALKGSAAALRRGQQESANPARQPDQAAGAAVPSAPALAAARAEVAQAARALDLAALKEPAAAAPAQLATMAPVQAATMAPAVAEAAGERIPARVGTPGWDSQVGQKIVWMVAGKEQSASLTLNPPDMGPMQVVLSVTNDQATVTFSAAQPEVRQALEDAMPKLREMMSESGISLGNASVNAGTQDQRQARHDEPPRGSRGHFGAGAGNEATVAPAPRRGRIDSGNGLVDTFA